MTKPSTKAPAELASPVSRAAILATFEPLLLAVPMAADDDGSGITAAVLQATNWEDVNVGGKLPEAEDFLNVDLKITSITRRESTLAERTSDWYLVIEGFDWNTGAPFTFGTSAQTIMAQGAKLVALNALPVKAKVVKSETATRAGRWPLSLVVSASAGAGPKAVGNGN